MEYWHVGTSLRLYKVRVTYSCVNYFLVQVMDSEIEGLTDSYLTSSKMKSAEIPYVLG